MLLFVLFSTKFESETASNSKSCIWTQSLAFFVFAKIFPKKTVPIKGTIQRTTSVFFIFKTLIKIPKKNLINVESF